MSVLSIVIDIETLSRRPGAIITEIGCFSFTRADFKIHDQFAVAPDIFQQLEYGRHHEPETIAFHRKQGTLPGQSVGISAEDTLHILRSFIEKTDPERVWIQGPDFDRPIIEDFCLHFGGTLPWEYWRTRDTRTLWDTAFPGVKHDKRPHTALGDCEATLCDLQRSLFALKGDQAHEAA